jgi:hypothetical protein
LSAAISSRNTSICRDRLGTNIRHFSLKLKDSFFADDENLAAELKRIADSSDVGIGPLCARFLSLIDTDDFPVPLPSGAKLREMFVVGTRARGIYATLPQPPGSERPFLTGGGHNDGHPFQLGVEAYIDDVPVRPRPYATVDDSAGVVLIVQRQRRITWSLYPSCSCSSSCSASESGAHAAKRWRLPVLAASTPPALSALPASALTRPRSETPLFAPFIYKMHHFTKTGSGQT